MGQDQELALNLRGHRTDPPGPLLGQEILTGVKELLDVPTQSVELGDDRSDSMDQFIGNLLAPKNVLRISYDEITRRATIDLAPDPMRLSSEVDPIRLRLGSELVGWDLVLR
jgi:hypothetical protein